MALTCWIYALTCCTHYKARETCGLTRTHIHAPTPFHHPPQFHRPPLPTHPPHWSTNPSRLVPTVPSPYPPLPMPPHCRVPPTVRPQAICVCCFASFLLCGVLGPTNVLVRPLGTFGPPGGQELLCFANTDGRDCRQPHIPERLARSDTTCVGVPRSGAERAPNDGGRARVGSNTTHVRRPVFPKRSDMFG